MSDVDATITENEATVDLDQQSISGEVSASEISAEIAGIDLNIVAEPINLAIEVAQSTTVYEYYTPMEEAPTGTINSTNTDFELSLTPVAKTVKVFLNGAFQTPQGEDYTISGTTITFVTAPRHGKLWVTYQTT